MENRRYSFTRVFFLVLAATVLLLFLLSRSIHSKGNVSTPAENKSAIPQNRVQSFPKSVTAHDNLPGPVHADKPVEDVEARLFASLLGQSHPNLDLQTRRVICQALMCLNNVSRVVESAGKNYPPTSSLLTELRSYGAALFRSDYSYACRICPELDPDIADAVYTNALAVLEISEFMGAASNVLEITSDSSGLRRPPAPMEDHYAVPFQSTADPEESMACSNLLATVKTLTSYDPLSTDLFNDAFVYVMSMTHMRQDREETLRGRAKIAHWERTGIPLMLDLDPDEPGWDDSLESYSDPGLNDSFAMMTNALREIFGYRFSEYHGLPEDATISELNKLSVPPTATWVHINPRQE